MDGDRLKTFVNLTADGNLLVAGQQVQGPDYTLNIADPNQPGPIQDSPTLLALGENLGLTTAQRTELFTTATKVIS